MTLSDFKEMLAEQTEDNYDDFEVVFLGRRDDSCVIGGIDVDLERGTIWLEKAY